MEPFFIRCETCRARLRVRDERFLGQVQSCPKCGSMVHIVAPAGWAAAGDTPSMPAEPAVAHAAAASTTAVWQKPAVLWSAGGAALLALAGVVGAMALGGDDEVAVVTTPPPAVQPQVVNEPQPDVEPTVDVASEAPAAVEGVAEQVVAESTAESATDAFLPIEPISTPKPEPSPTTASPMTEASSPAAETRTLTLEVVTPPQHSDSTSTAPAEPSAVYPSDVEVDKSLDLDRPEERPNRLTNIDDQLAMSIDSIELPAMPIGEFVSMISNMSAVPIHLDPKVLGDVGLSTRTKVVVKGGDITLRELLDRVLKEHNLACDERDGELVVVRAKQ